MNKRFIKQPIAEKSSVWHLASACCALSEEIDPATEQRDATHWARQIISTTRTSPVCIARTKCQDVTNAPALARSHLESIFLQSANSSVRLDGVNAPTTTTKQTATPLVRENKKRTKLCGQKNTEQDVSGDYSALFPTIRWTQPPFRQ